MTKARLVIQGNVYFQPKQGSGETVSIPSQAWEKVVESDEQPFVRHFTVGEEWIRLDVGWIREASFMVLLNNFPFYEKNPTHERRTEDQRKVVEIGTNHNKLAPDFPEWEIPPGHHHQGAILCPMRLMVRCRKGTTKVTLYLYPK